MTKFLIAGGSGFIGRHLCKGIEEQGGQVDLLTREPSSSIGYKQIRWDPSSYDGSLVEVVERYDVIVNLSGSSISKRWSRVHKEELETSRIMSTSSLVRAINSSHTKPKFMVNASAVGFYGNREGEKVQEDSSPGSDFLSNLSKKWESEASRVDKGVKLIIPRFGVVLGKDGGAFPALLSAAKRGISFNMEGKHSWKSWIHVDDAVSSVLFMMEREFEGTYNAVSPNPVELEVFMEKIADRLRKKAKLRLKASSIRFLLGEGGIYSTVYGQFVVPKSLSEKGFSFKYPDLTEALDSLLK